MKKYLFPNIIVFSISLLILYSIYPQASLAASPNLENAGKSKSSHAMTLSELADKYPQFFVMHGSSASPRVSLTFDDAPDPRFTPQILDILKKYHVNATFFIVGYRAKAYPELTKRIVREGHALGNHSYNHAYLPKLTLPQFSQQIIHTQQVIQQISGYTPKLIRPPYGEINEQQLVWAIERHFRIVNWNVDSLDWKSLAYQDVVHNIIDDVRPGSIILQHAGGGVGEDLSGTIQALPIIITKLQQKGYSFVTVPSLLKIESK